MPERPRAADRRHVERRPAPAPRSDRASRAWRGTTPGASPRTCRDRCCWRRRRCRGRASRRRPGTSSTGAVPLASFMLLSGLCDTPTPRRFRIAMSVVGHPDAVRGQRRRSPEADRLEIRRSASAGAARARSSTSSSVSARWIRTGTSYLRASARGRPRSVAVSLRVQRVRRDGRHDQAVVLERLDERARRAPAPRPASSRRRPETG